MATTIDNLSVKFGADFKELLAEMRKAEAGTKKFRGSVEKEMKAAHAAFERIGGQIKGALLGIAGGFTIAKIAGMARETLRWADDTKTLADRLGTSAESIQELVYAGREMNMTAQEMTKGLGEFAVKVAEAASGKGRGVVAFQEMGLSLRDAKGELKSFDELLDEFAGKIRQFDRPSQLALAKSFFGDEGALKFLDLLGKGKEHIRDLRQAARDAGLVLSNEVVAKGEALNKEVERLTDAINADLRRAFLDLGPVIEGSLKVLTSFLRDTKDFVEWLKGQGKLKWGALQPAPAPRAKEYMDLRTGARTTQIPLTPEFEEGRPLHDETVVPRNDAARAERTPATGRRVANLGGAGASQAETFRKMMEDLHAETVKAKAALDPYAAASADLDAKLAKMNATTAQGKQAKDEFNRAWDAKGAGALAEFGRESEHLAKVAEAEALGRRDLVAVLEMEFALRQRFDDRFVEQNKTQIEQMARLRFDIEEHRKRIQDMHAGIAGALESGALQATDAFAAFFDKNRNGWQEMGNAAISTLRAIMQEILMIMAIRPLAQAGAGWLSGLLGGAGGVPGLGEIGAAFPNLTFGFAEGGRPPVGVPSWVGERGKELFVPDVAGTIIPNHALGGGTATLYGGDSSTVELGQVKAMLRQLGVRVNQVDRSIEGRAVGAMVDARRRGGAVANTFG